jgi:hypothetical protein
LNDSKPENYVKLLSQIFRIKDALGTVYDYKPEPYQVEWHKRFYLVDREAPNRLWIKGRGVGATAITIMDLLMLAATYRGLTIPVSSVTRPQASMGPIEWGLWLCDNTRIPGVLRRNEDLESRVELIQTDSIIFPIPGNNPNSLRTYRANVIFYDEFDWCKQQRSLLAAGEGCMSEGGQATIISTIRNKRGMFQSIIDNSQELNYWVLRTPLWNPNTIDYSKPLQSQDLKTVAPWISVKRWEELRKRDLPVFLREAQCHAPDEGANFLDWDLINECTTISTYKGSHLKRWTKLRRDSQNFFSLGVDFARYKDLSAYEVLELTEFGWIQIYEQLLHGSDTKAQNALIDLLDMNFKLNQIRIDMTGVGQGLYDYAYAKHGSKVDGTHFGQRMQVGEQKAPKKSVYATNLRTLMQDKRVKLFDYLELRDDLHSVPYDLSEPKRTEEGSHGDRFWALALATWKEESGDLDAFVFG